MAIVPSTAEILSRSMRVLTVVPDLAMPVMNMASIAPPKSGVGSMSAAVKLATSSTPSTITP